MEKIINISVIIINYNTDKLTLQAVESVIKYTNNISYEIIVIDNCSPNGTNLATVLRAKPQVEFYKLKENIGFGRANNYAYTKTKGEYIYLLNSDAYLIENNIKEMYDYMKVHQNVASCGTKMLFECGKQNFSFGNFWTLKKMLDDSGWLKISKEKREQKISTSRIVKFSTPTSVDYISGASVMFKKSIIEILGFFDERFFMYYEDMELSYRFIKKGYKNIILPRPRVVHIGGQSGLITKPNDAFLRKEVAKSKNLFIKIRYGFFVSVIVTVLDFNYKTWFYQNIKKIINIYSFYCRI